MESKGTQVDEWFDTLFNTPNTPTDTSAVDDDESLGRRTAGSNPPNDWEKYVMDDMFTRISSGEMRMPQAGDRMISFADTVEILDVSEFRTNPKTGMTDFGVKFKVVEVHSPEDSSLPENDDDYVWLLFGDMISQDGTAEGGYIFVDEKIIETVEDKLTVMPPGESFDSPPGFWTVADAGGIVAYFRDEQSARKFRP